MKQRGFTLLEVIIYLTLFSLLMTGVLQTVFVVLVTTTSNQHKQILLAESTFLQQKFSWALTGATDISVLSSSTVTILRPDLGSASPLSFIVSGGRWYLKRGSADPRALTSSEILVSETEMFVLPGNSSLRPVLNIQYRLAGEPMLFQSVVPYE